jgi:fluoride ion exporter CrcB/FEX
VITLLAVLVGGCAGAVARQEIYSALQQRAGISFSVGILVVNLSDSFVWACSTASAPAMTGRTGWRPACRPG